MQDRPQHRVLLVEDDDEDALLMKEALTRGAQAGYSLDRVVTCDEACDRVAAESFDAIVVDLGLPDAQGLEAIARLRRAAEKVPILVTTGLDDAEAEAEALACGAQEYLVKGESQTSMLRRLLRHSMERQALLEQLRKAHSEENRQKEDFFSQVSHELRTPLSAVFQFVGLLRDQIAGPLNPEQSEFLEIIQRNVDQLRDMISDIMDVSRGSTGKLSVTARRVDLGALVVEAVESFRPEGGDAGIELVSNVPASLPPVLADPVRIRQVLHNLISNALKFTPEGGRIEVAGEPCDTGACVRVRDTGPGIPEAALQRIFERLGQVDAVRDQRRGGLGLGLYIAKHIIDRHRGQMGVESELGKGSVFWFSVPAFSLSSIVARLLEGDAEQIAVISVRLVDSAVDRATLESFVDVIQAKALRGSDVVVMPERDEPIFVIAPTAEEGAGLITARISEVSEGPPSLLPPGTKIACEWCVLHVPADQPQRVLAELESFLASGDA